MLRYTCLLLFICAFLACKESRKSDQAGMYYCPMYCEGDKTYSESGSCPVCKMDLVMQEPKERVAEGSELPEMSVYQLPYTWRNQYGDEMVLSDLRGSVVAAVMIYTSCQAACPRLVSDMTRIYEDIDPRMRENLKMVFVSIDPIKDTPERLKAYAQEHGLKGNQWVFLTGDEADTREFAATLAVSYKQISPMDFSHSNIISVFDRDGVLVFQQEGLGASNVPQVSKQLTKILSDTN